MRTSTTTTAGFAALLLGGCLAPAPAALPHDASPLDAGGLTGARSGGSSQRIQVDVDRVDIDTVMERLFLHGLDPTSARGLSATLAWRDLAARADADETVALPDLMRWFSRRTGRTILVDPSAAHERVSLGSGVFCSIRFED